MAYHLLVLLLAVLLNVSMAELEFEEYLESNRCIVCTNVLLLMSTAESYFIFTCAHGQFVHRECASTFFDRLDIEKKCPHRACNHAPLVNPLISSFFRIKLYDAYRALMPDGDNPGKCTACQEPIFRNGIMALRSHRSVLLKCNRGHYFHRRCGGEICSTCGEQLFNSIVWLDGYFELLALEQLHRLAAYYEMLVADVPSEDWRAMQSDFIAGSPRNFREPLLNRMASSQPRLQMVPAFSIQAYGTADEFSNPLATTKKSQYDIDIAAIEELDKDGEGLTTCTICLNKILGTYLPASTKYEEHIDAIVPNVKNHLAEMHLVCAKRHFSTNGYFCPVCRRNVLPLFKR